MKSANAIAFKEWASVQEAFDAGRQFVLMRKGGIVEKRGGFEVDHREFFFYPTQFHHNADDVVPDAKPFIEKAEAAAPPEGLARVSHYATVEEAIWSNDLPRLHKLAPFHIWTQKVVESRCDWGKKEGLWAIALRMRRLAEPVELPVLASYGGCTSWVTLEREIPTAGATPCVGDAVFAEKLSEIRAILHG